MKRIKNKEDLITNDEIKSMRTNPREISWDNVIPGKGIVPPIKPIRLKSGYMVSFTIDSIFNDGKSKLEHLIVGNEEHLVDPADADIIASLVLGKSIRINPSWHGDEKRVHYVKIIGLNEEKIADIYKTGELRQCDIVE